LARRHGPCGLVCQSWSPYEALTRAIAHQQLNGIAARTILARFVALFGTGRFPRPAEVLAMSPARIRRAGFSRAKAAWYLWRAASEPRLVARAKTTSADRR
jgi:DNA-3-methyladenine glycosylase II